MAVATGRIARGTGQRPGPKAWALLRKFPRPDADTIAHWTFAGLASLVIVLLAWFTYLMVTNSLPSLIRFGPGFLVTQTWDPVREVFGVLPFIYGTLVTSAIAILLSVPISLGIAVFLSEVATPRVRQPLSFLVELLAAIPSVVYGLWALFILVPIMKTTIEPFLEGTLGWLPLFQGTPFGLDLLTAGVVLAIMITPTVTAASREALLAAPRDYREAAYALGATRWEVSRRVVVPYVRSGLFGAVILGLGRAVGETMAVTMVIGNRPQISWSLLDPGYTLASVVANEFTEATTPMYVSALIEIGLVLFLIALLVNVLARLLIERAWRTHGKPRVGIVTRVVNFAARLSGYRTTERRRRIVDKTMSGLMVACLVIALVPLASILYEVVARGASALSPEFLTGVPVPAGEVGGGIGNAILGSFIIVGVAAAIGVPLGLASGIYVSEYGARGWLGRTIRLLNDVLTEFPSIVIGIFAYLAVVLVTGHFSAFAGSFALSIIMLPVVARTTEEALRLVPNDVREAALALGVPKWKATLLVTVPAAKGGIVTGALLAVARIMGETAPLILTVLGSSFWFAGLDQPAAAMPLTIYTYAISPFPDWHEKAWGAAFVLLIIVLTLNIVVRVATGRGTWSLKSNR
ncbi:MAG TPA: phosphate ABC transporter permease subunit PstC [Thermoplasmata archaeon]|nr:phosphate ABC transporter permease subunit PstC [Thermoplasmata archaeon]